MTDDSGVTRLAYTARIALLEEELSRKADRAERLEAQVAEMLAFRAEAHAARAQLEELRRKVTSLEDAVHKARWSASNAKAELRPHASAGADQDKQLVEDATVVARFLGHGTLSPATRPALRRLVA